MAKQLFEARQADLLAALSQKTRWCCGASFLSPVLEAATAALKGRELLRGRVPELPDSSSAIYVIEPTPTSVWFGKRQGRRE